MDNLLSPALELQPPDISDWRRGTGGPRGAVDYVHRFDSGRPGPDVLVTALVHGNELCGAIALDRLLRAGLRPDAGSLTLAFVNVAAFERFTHAAPYASRFLDEDLNRLWAPDVLDRADGSRERERARALRPLIDAADFLLDLHSMSQATEPLVLAGPTDKGLDLAVALGRPQTVVRDSGHAGGTRLRDYRAFADPASPRNALLVECGQHFAPASAAVALEVTLRFLVTVGSITAKSAAQHANLPPPGPPRVIEVTHRVTAESARFVFLHAFTGLERMARAGSVIAVDAGRPVVTPYDDCVLVMPVARPQAGHTAVRLGRELR